MKLKHLPDKKYTKIMNKPKNRSENIVVQEFASEILIYDLKTDKAYCLNETSVFVWRLCDGTKTVAEISQSLTKKLKQPMTEDVIWLALDGFKKDNLLEDSKEFEINFNGLNRRQVIKKVGFASMFALPIVSSIVAPNAAMAASGATNLALLATCPSTNGNVSCQSSNCVFTNNDGYRCCVSGATTGTFMPTQGSCSSFANCAAYGTSQCCSGSASTYPQLDGVCIPNFGRSGCICNS